MKIDLPDNMRRARRQDWRQLANITAEAFAEDPINRWVFGPPRSIKSAFRVMARDVYLKQGICHLAGDSAATMWLAPQQRADFSALTQTKFALGQALFGAKGAMKRAMSLGALMAQHHPSEPHMYLFTIGTRRAARGKGFGKALLSPVLAACDRAGVPVYLENSNPPNHGFYRAHGFETVTKFPVGEGGPIMEPMWREPRSL